VALFIELMTQEQFRYETIFEEQAEVLREDPPHEFSYRHLLPNPVNAGNLHKKILTSIFRVAMIYVISCHKILTSCVFATMFLTSAI
jgi:hypothetical protein